MLQWLLPAISYTVCTNEDAGIMLRGTVDVVFDGCMLEALILYSFRFCFYFLLPIIYLCCIIFHGGSDGGWWSNGDGDGGGARVGVECWEMTEVCLLKGLDPFLRLMISSDPNACTVGANSKLWFTTFFLQNHCRI